jgi:glutamate carboxypeptidase
MRKQYVRTFEAIRLENETRPSRVRPIHAIHSSALARVAILAAAALASPIWVSAQATLSAPEQRLVSRVDAGSAAATQLLERLVNQNSGSLNVAGVKAVAEMLIPEFQKLGFDARWVPLPASTGRAGHLIAERKGTRGKRLLLIGHLDTVFEPSSPFQKWVRTGDMAKGPGAIDMKGGDVVMLLALQALEQEGALDGATITVVLTGDEESTGQPLDVSRKDLIDAARRSDVALTFENLSREPTGDMAVIARRSSSSWRVEIKATTGHSRIVFTDEIGAGAVYEAGRILDTFYGELRGERYLTFNASMILGGTDVAYDASKAGGTAAGKTNVVPQSAILTGDIRTISQEQLDKTRERMRAIVARSLPGTQSTITFTDSYPSMPPTAANQALLGQYSDVSRALGFPAVGAMDPGVRGAADISFVASIVQASMDGLGVFGSGEHTVEETIDVRSIPIQAKRAAVLIYRLTR